MQWNIVRYYRTCKQLCPYSSGRLVDENGLWSMKSGTQQCSENIVSFTPSYNDKWHGRGGKFLKNATYLKWRITNASLYRRPSRRRRGSWTSCTGGSSSSSPPSKAAGGCSPSGILIFLILQMLCSIAQTSTIWQTLDGGPTRISLCRTWKRRFSCPMPLSTTLRVFLCALYEELD